MEMFLAKFLITCLICGLIQFTESFPVDDAYYQDTSIKHKRSNPLEGLAGSGPLGLPSLPFSLPNPISNVQQMLGNIGNILKSPGASLNDKDDKPTESGSDRSKRSSIDAITNLSSEPKDEYKNSEIPTSDLLVKSNTVKQNVQANKQNTDVIDEKGRTLLQPVAEVIKGLKSNQEKDVFKNDKTSKDVVENDAVPKSVNSDDTTEASEHKIVTDINSFKKVPSAVTQLVG